MRRIVVILADTHGGHKLGLMGPDVKLLDIDQEGKPTTRTPVQTAVQKWLWQSYEADMASVKTLAGRSEVVVIHNGDITWGRKYPDALVSGREYDQQAIAMDNIRPWLEWRNVKTMRLLHGTESHEFGQGSSTIAVAAQLQAESPKRDIKAIRHGLFAIDGVLFDVAHHRPGPGIRQWTSGNQLRYYLKSLMNDEILRGNEPPRVVVGAHYHTYKHEVVTVQGIREWISDIYICPAYCGMTHYAQQATRSSYLLTCGMLAFEIEDGALKKAHAYKRIVDLRTKEVL